MPPREAIAASLFIVGVTSAVSVLRHARAARVRWATGAIFGAAGMLGAFAGGFLGGYVPGTVLMVLFAVMMVATAVAMVRGRRRAAGGGEQGTRTRRPARVSGGGRAVGDGS